MSVKDALAVAKQQPKYEQAVARFKITDIEYIVETGFAGTLRVKVDYDMKDCSNEEPIPMKKTFIDIV